MNIIFKKKFPSQKTNLENNIYEKNYMKINENEDEKKLIDDSKIYDLLDKDKNIDDKLIHNNFSKSLFNKNYDYSPRMFDIMNLHPNNKIDKNNMSFSNLQNIHSSSLASLTNLNPTLSQMNRSYMFNRYNYDSSTTNLINNNMLPLGAIKGNTLLSPSPPPLMGDYSFPVLTNNNNQIFSQNNNKIINTSAVNNINNINENKQNYNLINNNSKKIQNQNNNRNLSEKSNSEIQLFNKKRKRYIKNNKLVFILNEKKKIKKNLEKNDKNENNENNEKNKNNDSKIELNEENSEKVRKPRGSKYRGVSRNGNQWQVLIMVNKKKRYVGSFSKEEDAAHSYDKVALQNHGSKAKTNFDYTKKEVEEILAAPQLLKSC